MNILNQIILRLFSGTPLFFTVIKWVSFVVGVIIIVPDLIDTLTGAGVILPTDWYEVVEKIVGYAALVAAFISQLTLPTDIKIGSKLD